MDPTGSAYRLVTMRLTAAASAALDAVLTGPPRLARVLGVTAAAAYFLLPGRPDRAAGAESPTVVAVVTVDAVRLPCSVVVGFASTHRSLRALAPWGDEPVLIGHGKLRWTSRFEPIVVDVVRSWTPARVPIVGPAGLDESWTDGLGLLRAATLRVDIGIDESLLNRRPCPSTSCWVGGPA